MEIFLEVIFFVVYKFPSVDKAQIIIRLLKYVSWLGCENREELSMYYLRIINVLSTMFFPAIFGVVWNKGFIVKYIYGDQAGDDLNLSGARSIRIF